MGTAERLESYYALLDRETMPRKLPRRNKRGVPLGDLPTLQESFANATTGLDPKYVTIKLANEGENITDMNPFVVCKMIEHFAPKVRSLKALRDGTYLAFLPSHVEAEKLIRNFKKIDEREVKVEYHNKLNESKGTAFAPNLKRLTEEEILEGLKEKNKTITGVKKLTRPGTKQDERIPTGALQITFDTFTPPSTIVCCLERLEVRRWYPAPLRCRKCYQFRHHESKCKNTPTCQGCGVPKAEGELGHVCGRVYCIACEKVGEHVTLDKKCPSFTREKEIVKIQVDNHITRYEARKRWYAMYGNLAPVQDSSSKIIPGFSFSAAAKNAQQESTAQYQPQTYPKQVDSTTATPTQTNKSGKQDNTKQTHMTNEHIQKESSPQKSKTGKKQTDNEEQNQKTKTQNKKQTQHKTKDILTKVGPERVSITFDEFEEQIAQQLQKNSSFLSNTPERSTCTSPPSRMASLIREDQEMEIVDPASGSEK